MEGRFQVILTAHHPLAVDFLAASNGMWLEREPSGPTRVQRIHVSDDFKKEPNGMRISDLIARGWLSSLGVSHGPPAEGITPSLKRPNA